MIHFLMAILLGLACPSHSNNGSKDHNGTVVRPYGDGDEKPVGGDGGHIPPFKQS